MKNIYLFTMALFIGHSSFSITSSASNGKITDPKVLKHTGAALPGAALNFDGVDDLVNTGTGISTVLNTKNQITVEAWVYPTANTGNGAIVGNLSASNGEQQFYLRRDDDNQYAFFVDDNTGYKGVYSGVNTLVMNTWQHVAGVWDGTALYIYIDGVLKLTQSGVTGPHFFNAANPVCIGGIASGSFFQGNIDEVRIWSRALCVSEILADRNCEIKNKAPGLLANYHFNQGTAGSSNTGVLTLSDSSGNVNDGALQDFALMGATSNWVSPGAVTSGTNCTPYNGISSVGIASQTNVSCYGKNNGAATISVTGLSPTYSWAPSGGTAATATGLAAGTYTVTVTSGCSGSMTQIVTITEPPAITKSQTFTVCAGKSVTVGIHTYTVTGIYKDTLTAKNTCDSIVTTNLTVNPAIASTQTFTLCAGKSVTVGSHTYTVTGTYKDTLIAKNACDSVVTTNLTVNPLITSTQAFILCAGKSVTVGSHTYTATGTYKDTLIAKNACDSVVTTNLTVNPLITSTQAFILCAGKSVTVGSHTYTVTGTYKDTLIASNACDSVVTTNLTVYPVIASTQAFILCAGKSVTVGLHTYTVTGTYKDTLIAKNGCDSVVTTNLTVNPAIASTQAVTVCAGGSLTVGLHTYTVSGTYKDTLLAKNGCDSVVTSNLTVNNAIDVGITVSGNVITATATGATYQWIDCNKANAPIAGATNNSYVAPNGTYAVIVTIGSCSDTSICQQVISIGITNADMDNTVKIYPNPSSGLVNLELSSSQQIQIINATGQVVYNNILNTGKHQIDLQKEPAGLYIVQLVGNNTAQRIKLMKE